MRFSFLFIALFTCSCIAAQPCFDNNDCGSAEDLGLLSTTRIDLDCGSANDPFTCVEGCNLEADPYEGGPISECLNENTPVVWYTFRTGDSATLANINVTSDDFSTPALQLFRAFQGDCGSLMQIGACAVGSDGEVSTIGVEIGANQTYYLSVGAVNSTGGDFEVCISILQGITSCVTDAEIEVVARSESGSLEGPFLSGETVSLCFNINGYTAIGNNCQWLQGVIPTFGNGWDPGSFNEEWMPVLNTEVHGQSAVDGSDSSIPVNGIYTGQWAWFNDVTYHHDNCFYNIGDFDGNGSLDICHALFSEDCDGPGLTGGCCANCWQDQPGALLPPGWYAYGTTGNCPMNDHPTVDWGDGSGCGNMSGPWTFCFDLKVREFPDCDQDPSTMDLSVGFFTTADGETGAWGGGPSVCAFDAPLRLDLPGCCGEKPEDKSDVASRCSGDELGYVLDFPGVTFWEVDVQSTTGVDGASSGGLENGESINDVLVLAGDEVGTVVYNALGYSGLCGSVRTEITVEVYPEVPTADFSMLQESTTVMFNNTSENGSIYYWDFGNGDTSSLLNPVVDFGDLGDYEVRLIVTNACGADTAVMQISLSGSPIPLFSADMQSGCAPFEVQFLDMSQNGPQEWLWSFPGGVPEVSTEPDPKVRYETPGVYDVELKVTNGNGEQTLIVSDYVEVAETPDAGFSASVFNNTAIFSNNSIGLGTVVWDFGDGATSDLIDPLHSYKVPGKYQVLLVVSNECGVDSVIREVTVLGPSFTEFPDDTVKVFPNPNNGQFVVNINEVMDDDFSFQVIGLDGRVVASGQLNGNSTELDLSGRAAPGVYQLVIVNGLESHVTRIVVIPD